ncbi:MAG: M1 family aminopeptidase, partial [Rhodothermales bacterium]
EARMNYHPGQDHFLPDQRLYTAVAEQGLVEEMMVHSAYHTTGLSYGIASYMKPASVLNALRGVLEEDVFYEAYRTFIDEWAYRHPYPWDFFHTVERVSGRDLDWFWRSWYYEPWTLDQGIEDVQIDGDETTIVVRDHGLVPMPVLLGIELENGEVIGRRIPVSSWLQGATTASFVLTTESPVVRVAIDPQNLFPDVDLSDNDWYRDDEPAGGASAPAGSN